MINPDFTLFDDNMFIQVRQLLGGVSPDSALPVIDVTVGEPRIAPPDILSHSLNEASANWQAYPKAVADQQFLDDLHLYFEDRFPSLAGNFDYASHIVPVPGTREPLHFLGICVAGAKQHAAALVSMPFYHAWRTGAMATGGEIIYMPAFEADGFLPDLSALDNDLLHRTSMMVLCSPTNPQGSIASADYIAHAIELARQYDFLLVMDECYIDIWRGEKPVSALEVAMEMSAGEDDPFHHLIVLNSLSKRSSAAGLRVGFICGDRQLCAAYLKLVSNGGALVPTSLLRAGGALYRDSQHNADIRAHYDRSFDILKQHLDIIVPQGGFFLWYPVPRAFNGDDKAYAVKLFQSASIKSVPGSVMATDVGAGNPGAGFVRLAIVHDHETIEILARRMATLGETL